MFRRTVFQLFGFLFLPMLFLQSYNVVIQLLMPCLQLSRFYLRIYKLLFQPLYFNSNFSDLLVFLGEQLNLVFRQFTNLHVKFHDGRLILVDLGTVLQWSYLVFHLLEFGLMLQLLNLELTLLQHLVAHVRDGRLVVNALRKALIMHSIIFFVHNLELLCLYVKQLSFINRSRSTYKCWRKLCSELVGISVVRSPSLLVVIQVELSNLKLLKWWYIGSLRPHNDRLDGFTALFGSCIEYVIFHLYFVLD